MFWRRKKPKEKAAEEKRDWVMVAGYSPLEGDGLADLAVAKLNAHGIPAMRFPEHTLVAHVTVMGASQIRVMAPSERAQEARELLADETA